MASGRRIEPTCPGGGRLRAGCVYRFTTPGANGSLLRSETINERLGATFPASHFPALVPPRRTRRPRRVQCRPTNPILGKAKRHIEKIRRQTQIGPQKAPDIARFGNENETDVLPWAYKKYFEMYYCLARKA